MSDYILPVSLSVALVLGLMAGRVTVATPHESTDVDAPPTMAWASDTVDRVAETTDGWSRSAIRGLSRPPSSPVAGIPANGVGLENQSDDVAFRDQSTGSEQRLGSSVDNVGAYNRTVSLDEVQAPFANRNGPVIRNNPEKFDFDENGRVNVVDVQKLFNEILNQ